MTVMKYLRNCGFISYLIDVSACCGDGDGDSDGACCGDGDGDSDGDGGVGVDCISVGGGGIGGCCVGDGDGCVGGRSLFFAIVQI